jgi:carotenoid cleavage dioxygenase-like enzyme
MTDSARFSWTVLLPVKVLARAKSRLAVLAGDRRGELAIDEPPVATLRIPIRMPGGLHGNWVTDEQLAQRAG